MHAPEPLKHPPTWQMEHPTAVPRSNPRCYHPHWTSYTAATKSNSIDVFSILVIDFVIAIRSARICNVRV